MAGQTGAFTNALDDIRKAGSSDKTPPKPTGSKPAPGARPEVTPKAPRPETHSEPQRALQGRRTSRTEPFNHRINGDVKALLYDLALSNDWTMNRTLREAANALAAKLDNKNGGGL